MLPFSVLFSEARRSLAAHGRRSALTLLGIAWGITTFVMLLSYGSGFRGMVLMAFESFGTNVLEVMGGRTSEQAGGERAGRQIRMKMADMEYVQASVPLVKKASPEWWWWTKVNSPARSQEFPVLGVYPVYSEIRSMVVEEGRWLNAGDEAQCGRVAVLGSFTRERLFGEQTALGGSVRIGTLSFEVIGVLRRKVGEASWDNRQVLIPYCTMGLMQPTPYLDAFVVEIDGRGTHAEAERLIRARLAERLHFRPTDRRALWVWNTMEMVENVRKVTAMVQVMVGFIGALTLAIGGVGVTNIMLVSVTQRTREIGVRKAVGARRRHILAQFLAEGLLLTFVGGLLGLALSYFLVWLLPPVPLWSAVAGDEGKGGDIVLGVNGVSLLASALLLGVVGLLAGFWPAWRASRLDPVEALRYE
jgi:putative ABC transport system permease protein